MSSILLYPTVEFLNAVHTHRSLTTELAIEPKDEVNKMFAQLPSLEVKGAFDIALI